MVCFAGWDDRRHPVPKGYLLMRPWEPDDRGQGSLGLLSEATGRALPQFLLLEWPMACHEGMRHETIGLLRGALGRDPPVTLVLGRGPALCAQEDIGKPFSQGRRDFNINR